MGVSLCYLKVPCAALTRAHGGGTSLCRVACQGEPQFPSLVLQQPSSPQKNLELPKFWAETQSTPSQKQALGQYIC